MAKTYLNKAATGLILAAAVLAASDASAQTISLTPAAQFGDTNDPWGSVAVDPVTGYYYLRPSYDTETTGATPTVIVYDSKAAFLSNQPSGTIPLSGNQEGTYFAVNNGTLYSRNDSTSNVVGEWNLATGMETGTVTFSDMAPAANGTDTFNVNDYTGMNFLQDSTGLYVLGVSANGQDWTLDKVNPMLSVLQSYTFSDPNDPTDPLTIGFAFMAGGELFMGDSYNDPTISYVFNPAADELSDVDITLNGLPSNVYIEGATYVSQTDSLYIVDVLQNTNSILSPYSASGVYVANRVSPALSIPEPSTWALLVTGLAAFLGRSFLRRKGAVRASR